MRLRRTDDARPRPPLTRLASPHLATPHLSRTTGLEMPPEALVMSAGPLGLVRSLRRQRKAISEGPAAMGASSVEGSPQRGGKLRVARACQEARAVTDHVDRC